jgi:hypothetical protein
MYPPSPKSASLLVEARIFSPPVEKEFFNRIDPKQ